jgi:HlyD family secretion protein
MDIARPSNARQKRIRQIIYVTIGLAAVGLITLGLSRLKPAAPTVEMAVVWPDTVRRGPMVRQVRGLGTLVPEDIRWIPATTQGRVESITLRPGTAVRPDSVILELTNPQVTQAAGDADLQLKAEQANLSNLKVQLQNDYLQQKAAAQTVESDYAQAKMQLDMNEALAKDKLVSDLVLRQSKVRADELNSRREIEQTRLKATQDTMQARLSVQESRVDQTRALVALRRREMAELKVRAGFAGMLQLVPVERGQQVGPGTNLARVADPSRLKAELKIAETQAKDIQIGQIAEIDTRNGVVKGKVIRIDPSVQNGTRTVDVSLDGALPKGAVPDLSVDGTIELERLPDVLFMGRPAFGQEQSTVGLFKIDSDGAYANRTQVKLGRSSVNTVEVLSGLRVGDRVILSDMSQFDAYDRVKLK